MTAPSDETPTRRRWLAWRILTLAVAIEVFTIAMRYLFGLQATRDTASTIGVWTGGLRIHHGYVGLLMMALALGLRRRLPTAAGHLTVWGAALVLSDLAHHFLVLWPIEGSPEFHLWYGDGAPR